MQQIYPLHEHNVSRFCGLPVLVVMQDGSRYKGILSSCGSGRLVLNGRLGEHPDAALTTVKPAEKKKKKGGKHKQEPDQQDFAQTQAFNPYYDYGYYPWGGPLLFDLALIAFLFLLI